MSYVGQEILRRQMLHIEATSSSTNPYELDANTGNLSGDVTSIEPGVFSFSFWMYFDDFGSDSEIHLVSANNGSNPDRVWCSIESGSLVLTSYYTADSIETGHVDFEDKWYLNNFTSSYSGSFVHCTLVHSGTHYGS